MKKKAKATITIFFIFSLLIVFQLARWQIFDYENWKSKADARTLISKIRSQRGAILASDGTTLAIDEQVYGIYINTKNVKDKNTLISKLAPLLEMSEADIQSKMSNENANYFSIKHGVSEDVKNKVETLRKSLDKKVADGGSIITSEEVKRINPNNELAAHVIGYTEHSEDYKSLIGRYGIEGPWDGILQGTEGYERSKLDRAGNAILTEDIKSINAKNGTRIELTIDVGIQSIAERALKEHVNKQGAKSGSVIIIKPKTGEIVALANYPTFDPNKYYEGEIIDCSLGRYIDNPKCKKPEPTPQPTITPTTETSITPSSTPTPTPSPTPTPVPVDFAKIYRNNAVSRLFEAGSVIKTLTVAAGIQENLYHGESIMPAHKGCENILEDKYVCKWDRAAAPARALKDAVADSDNLAMKEIAYSLGKEKLYDYFNSFGLNSKVNANLDGEEVSRLKAPVEMNKLDLATMSFGQSFNLSALQIIQSYIPIANGGEMVHPHIIKSFISDEKKVDFVPQKEPTMVNAETTKEVRNILQYATLNSTALMQLGDLLKKYEIAGKTGTAQIPNENGPGYKRDKVNTTYVAFAPVDEPEVIMLVTLEEVNGQVLAGSTALPMWRDIAVQAFPLMNIKTK